MIRGGGLHSFQAELSSMHLVHEEVHSTTIALFPIKRSRQEARSARERGVRGRGSR